MKRIKRRYLALQVEGEGEPSRRELLNAVWDAVTWLYGDYGASMTGLALINYDAEAKTAVLRTSLETLNLVRASLATITSVASTEATVHVLAVSGTIKALNKKTKKQK